MVRTVPFCHCWRLGSYYEITVPPREVRAPWFLRQRKREEKEGEGGVKNEEVKRGRETLMGEVLSTINSVPASFRPSLVTSLLSLRLKSKFIASEVASKCFAKIPPRLISDDKWNSKRDLGQPLT